MVQKRPRYIFGCTPRVNGYDPGIPRSVSVSRPSGSQGQYTRRIGKPETVEKAVRRSGFLESFPLSFSSHCSTVCLKSADMDHLFHVVPRLQPGNELRACPNIKITGLRVGRL